MKLFNEVQEAFKFYGGVATLEQVYTYMKQNYDYESEYATEDGFKSTIRKVIYRCSSDCDIYEGKNNIFMSEDGKGNGVWRMRRHTQLESINDLYNLNIGASANAQEISNISGTYRMKGIHPIEDGVIILCTLKGDSYLNEWIDKPNTLKYYLEGKKDNQTGIKTYNVQYKSNQAVINSTKDKPVYLFLREKDRELYTYYGKFINTEIGTEPDGGKYFILQKIDTVVHLSEIIESIDDEEFPEGKLIERRHKSRERNPRLIKQAKEAFKKKHGRLFCEACSFDFEKFYGKELGEDFIEAHHKIPLHKVNDRTTTKVSDLAMVCANCHRMLHKKRPWLSSVEELKEIINNLN